MFRKSFSFGSALLLAGAAILATPSESQAQRGGRGYYGGGRGGISFGIGNYGGYRGGIYPGGFGSSLGGFGYGGYSRPYYRSYNTVPFYNTYRYSRPYYGQTYSYGSVSPYATDGSVFVEPSTSLYYSATDSAMPDNRAHLAIQVPPDAQVWFGDTPTDSTGAVRRFDSPPLNAGSQYSYVIRARWNENGREVTQSQEVDVTAGSRVNVRFPTRETATPQPAVEVR